jgi:lysozyme family protein
MSDKFDYAIPFILAHEGGYCNVSGDAGGETKFGICKRSYPNLDIKNLTVDSAINIYRADYWQPWMDTLSKRVAAKVFDICVNCGVSTGAKILQMAAGVEVDGQVGIKTISACNMMAQEDLLQKVCDEQMDYYNRIVARKPSQLKFIKGWSTRANWKPA